jgi:hypothetical protein
VTSEQGRAHHGPGANPTKLTTDPGDNTSKFTTEDAGGMEAERRRSAIAFDQADQNQTSLATASPVLHALHRVLGSRGPQSSV